MTHAKIIKRLQDELNNTFCLCSELRKERDNTIELYKDYLYKLNIRTKELELIKIEKDRQYSENIKQLELCIKLLDEKYMLQKEIDRLEEVNEQLLDKIYNG